MKVKIYQPNSKLTNYTRWLIRKDLAKNTINNYRQAISLYGEKPLTTANLRAYFHQNLTHYEPSSLYTKIKALTVYARYQRIKINWEQILRIIPKYQQKYFPTLTEQELVKLKLVRFEESANIYQRNNLIIDFLFYTGLRVSELINIKLVDYQDGKLQVYGKGNKIRYVFLPPFLLTTLTNAYESDYLFSTKQGHKLSRVSISKIVEGRAKLAGIKKVVSPHTFRRTFATNSYNQGVRLDTIQKQLGHSSLDTTMTYNS